MITFKNYLLENSHEDDDAQAFINFLKNDNLFYDLLLDLNGLVKDYHRFHSDDVYDVMFNFLKKSPDGVPLSLKRKGENIPEFLHFRLDKDGESLYVHAKKDYSERYEWIKTNEFLGPKSFLRNFIKPTNSFTIYTKPISHYIKYHYKEANIIYKEIDNKIRNANQLGLVGLENRHNFLAFAEVLRHLNFLELYFEHLDTNPHVKNIPEHILNFIYEILKNYNSAGLL